MKTPGKTLTIFVVLVLILLVCSTSIGFFLYHKEETNRIELESQLSVSKASEGRLQAELKSVKSQLTLLQDKNKEADEKINNLMDEIELNESLRKELKSEISSTKEQLEKLKKEKEQIAKDMQDVNRRYKEAGEMLKIEQDKASSLQDTIKELTQAKIDAETKMENLRQEMKSMESKSPMSLMPSTEPKSDLTLAQNNVELDKIVVNPNEGTKGRVLSVDKDAEFIVSNIGLKQGVKTGDVLSVFRGDEYLGDVRVSRVQEELSAADIIPPFSSRRVRKNDTVVFKS